MMVPRRLAILQALTAQIASVTPANGYATDLTGRVYRGRAVFGKEVTLPFVSILESPRPGNEIEANEEQLRRSTTWPLLVQGWATDDKDNPLDPAYELSAAVEKQLARVVQRTNNGGLAAYPMEYLFGKLITGMAIGPGVCRPPADAASAAFFYLPVTLTFAEDLVEPFIFVS